IVPDHVIQKHNVLKSAVTGDEYKAVQVARGNIEQSIVLGAIGTGELQRKIKRIVLQGGFIFSGQDHRLQKGQHVAIKQVGNIGFVFFRKVFPVEKMQIVSAQGRQQIAGKDLAEFILKLVHLILDLFKQVDVPGRRFRSA